MPSPERRARAVVHAVVVAAILATAASAAVLPSPAARAWAWGAILILAPAAVHSALARLARAQRLRWAAEHDALTRLANRAQMALALARAWRDARRRGQPLAVVLVEADRLGEVNAAFGRPVGDRVLAEIGDACRRAARPDDRWGRWRGDVFLGVLPDAGGRTAMILAEQVRAAVARLAVATREGVDVRVTVSAGVAVDTPDRRSDSADDLVDAADRALYAAKRAGRDRITAATRPRLPSAALPAPAPG